MKELTELAERCERASGPDRELDELVSAAVVGAVREVQSDGRIAYHTDNGARWTNVTVIPVTASLDAALTLVPEGWTGIIPVSNGDEAWLWERNGNPKGHRCNAATPALALCAAALRSRANNRSESNG